MGLVEIVKRTGIGVSVRENDVWGTRAPVGGKRRKGGTSISEVVGAHKVHPLGR